MGRKAKVYNLILCGGVGSRLWPLSTPGLPKQFANLLPGPTLFERNILRNRNLVDGTLIAANAHQMGLALAQMAGLGSQPDGGLVEPVGRNTAPAIALVAMRVDPEDILLITPSDHVVTDQDSYEKSVSSAIIYASDGHIVTFGIEPTWPETGYGYIQAGEALSIDEDKGYVPAYMVKEFKEKPDKDLAKRYLDAGNFTWNSGMFCAKAGLLLSELEQHAWELHRACHRAHQRAEVGNNGLTLPNEADMIAIPAISIDYALMEHTNQAVVLPCEIGWSDLGSFESVYEVLASNQDLVDADGNVDASGRSSFVESRGSVHLSSGSGKRIVFLGAEDVVVAEGDDAILVMKAGMGQQVRDLGPGGAP